MQNKYIKDTKAIELLNYNNTPIYCDSCRGAGELKAKVKKSRNYIKDLVSNKYNDTNNNEEEWIDIICNECSGTGIKYYIKEYNI